MVQPDVIVLCDHGKRRGFGIYGFESRIPIASFDGKYVIGFSEISEDLMQERSNGGDLRSVAGPASHLKSHFLFFHVNRFH